MRLLTWNIQWGRGADGRVDLARTVAAIRAAGEVDVICLQEVACNFPGLGDRKSNRMSTSMAHVWGVSGMHTGDSEQVKIVVA
jgi:endonuclease/exonuclease/phosphatase family metal-dependent hydrolase